MIKPHDHILIVDCRNLGDAVIKTTLIESLACSFPEITIDVFTRPSFKFIFQNNPHIKNIYYSDFPFWRDKNPKWSQLIDLAVIISSIRKQRYDMCINTVGDFRENLISALIATPRNVSVIWEKGHPFSRLVRFNKLFLRKTNSIVIPRNVVNYYDVHNYIVDKLGGKVLSKPKIYLKEFSSSKSIAEKIVGIHPLSSQQWNMWSFERWISLTEKLIQNGLTVWAFCAPNEKEMLDEIFQKIRNNHKFDIKAESLISFFNLLSHTNLFIGLNSFSIHCAYALNIPNIMINGGSDYRIFMPKNSLAIYDASCKYFPCFYNAHCIKNAKIEKCINNISVEQIMKMVRSILNMPDMIL